MKVTEHIQQKTPWISFEIVPPIRGTNCTDIISLIDSLVQYHPPFIDVTSHVSEKLYSEGKERVIRKRPGTLGICALIQHKYRIDAVPHVLCNGFTREETEDFLIELQYLSIKNVLALQGDKPNFVKKVMESRSQNKYAVDLVRQIQKMNNGIYLDAQADKTSFCIGVAGYPEKHFLAPDLETDLQHLKNKIIAGADYITTQMFFDNSYYFNFIELCKQRGINVPIIPGLKIITSMKQLEGIPRRFSVTIPSLLEEEVRTAKEKNVSEIGVLWATQQVQELLDRGVPGVHFYVMNSTEAVKKVLSSIRR
ncbi:MAG: methylenetetrahydrofolate reductase [Nanoarchaeota archaeon]|nr:methylenetetrahydrofolate reductase [Nanoarchaeota archaeon]